jgi:outer membrane protein assembly factor BamB
MLLTPAVCKSGTVQAQVEIFNPRRSSERGGCIFVASVPANAIFGLNPDGTQKWSAPVVSPAESPAIGMDGTIYSLGGGGVYAFSPNGNTLWATSDPQSFGVGPSSSLAIDKDGTIYVAAVANFEFVGYGFRLYAITPAGATKWQVRTNLAGNYGATLGTPAVDAARVIYFAAYTRLFAFSADGSVVWIFNAGGSPTDLNSYTYTSPAIGSDGTIYATFGSRLYAFAGTNSLADSPWPMYRQNARHTGKMEKPSLQKPQKRADANFQFQVFGQISNTFTIEASTNLSDWTWLTNFALTNVPMDVLDLDATNFPLRFYRAVSDAPP